MHGEMPRPSNFDLYDRHVFKGHLARKLASWREQGDSYEDIAYRLRTEHGVNVTGVTVGRWLHRLNNVA